MSLNLKLAHVHQMRHTTSTTPTSHGAVLANTGLSWLIYSSTQYCNKSSKASLSLSLSYSRNIQYRYKKKVSRVFCRVYYIHLREKKSSSPPTIMVIYTIYHQCRRDSNTLYIGVILSMHFIKMMLLEAGFASVMHLENVYTERMVFLFFFFFFAREIGRLVKL